VMPEVILDDLEIRAEEKAAEKITQRKE